MYQKIEKKGGGTREYTSQQSQLMLSSSHDLYTQGPFVIKHEFSKTNTVKGMAISCDQNQAFFNMSRHILHLDIKKDILEKTNILKSS
jgi:hypothetical protein